MLRELFAMFAVAAGAGSCHSSQSRNAASTSKKRAQALVELGELSSARQVLEGATCAPGDDTTRVALTNPARRPPELRAPLPEELIRHRPATQFSLDQDRFFEVCSEGAAGSGMTTDRLKVVLNRVRDNEMLWQMAEEFFRWKGSVWVG